MWKRIFRMNRYFIGVWNSHPDLGLTIGEFNIQTAKGKFIDMSELKMEIKIKTESDANVTIVNILEVSKSDYKDYLKINEID